MKVRITKTFPSKFDPGLVYQSRTIDKQLQTQQIVLGRGEQLQKLYQNKIDVVSVSHMSISRQHASLTLPYFFAKSNAVSINSMVIRNGILFPKYYFRLGGIFTNMPSHLLFKIRQYCCSTEAIVITDLNSKFGLYRHIRAVKIVDIGYKNNCNSDKLLLVSKEQKIIFQMGNENMEIFQLIYGVSYTEINKYKKQIIDKIKNIKYFHAFGSVNPKITCQKYYSMIIKHYSQGQQSQNGTYYCICVSKKNGEESNKILIGRHDQCHIQLKRSEVSRKQAKIYVDIDGQWIIQDANSTNGTWLKCNKIIYKIEQLSKKSNISSQKSNSSNNISSIEEQKSGYNQQDNKLKSIIIKLGEVKFDLQFQGIHEIKNQLFNHIQQSEISSNNKKMLCEQPYTKVLNEISGFEEEEEDQYLKQQKQCQCFNDEEKSENEQLIWDVGIDQSFQLDSKYNNIYKEQPEKNTCINMNILGEILDFTSSINQNNQIK